MELSNILKTGKVALDGINATNFQQGAKCTITNKKHLIRLEELGFITYLTEVAVDDAAEDKAVETPTEDKAEDKAVESLKDMEVKAAEIAEKLPKAKSKKGNK